MTAARQQLGAQGEEQAARWYRRHGYVVVARNWRSRHGEIDLICRQGSLVVVAEVKTRRSDAYGHPAEAVTPAKQQRIRRLAAAWLAEQPPESNREVRFDVVAILGGRIDVRQGVF